jgi:hypothetical protein
VIALALVLSGCGSPQTTATAADASSRAPDAGTTFDCGDLAQAVCGQVAEAAVSSVLRQGPIIHVELGRGVWCPTPGLLFANTTCPGGALAPAGGGQWIGHARITFAGSSAQAYVNVAQDATSVHAALVALATPPPQSPGP